MLPAHFNSKKRKKYSSKTCVINCTIKGNCYKCIKATAIFRINIKIAKICLDKMHDRYEI